MDKIVEIVRRGGVARIKLLSGEVLRAPSPLFLERRVRTGEEIDAEAYRAFLRQRGYPHAMEAAGKFLMLRERSEQEVRQRLRRSCYDEDTIERVIAALFQHSLISDARFAQQWVARQARKYGRGRIAQELKMKGVDGEEARRALEDLPEEEELGRALSQARKMVRRFQGNPQKIAQALIRRGYNWSMAKKAAEEAVAEEE